MAGVNPLDAMIQELEMEGDPRYAWRGIQQREPFPYRAPLGDAAIDIPEDYGFPPLEEGPAAPMPADQPIVRDPNFRINVDYNAEANINADQIIADAYAQGGRDIFNEQYIDNYLRNQFLNDPNIRRQYQALGNRVAQENFLDAARNRIAISLANLMGVPQNEAERQLMNIANQALQAVVRHHSRNVAGIAGGVIGGIAGSIAGPMGAGIGSVGGAAAGTIYGQRLGGRYADQIAFGAERQLMQRGMTQQNARYTMLAVSGLIGAYPNRELIGGIITSSIKLPYNVGSTLLNFVDKYIYEIYERPQVDPTIRGTDITDYSKTVFGTKYLNPKTFMPTEKSGKATYRKNNRDQMVSAVMKEQKRINSLKLKNIPDPTLADLQAQRIEVANRAIPNFNCLTIQKEGLYHPYPVWDAPTHLQNKIYRTVERTQEEKGLFHEVPAYLPLERHGTHRTNLGNY